MILEGGLPEAGEGIRKGIFSKIPVPLALILFIGIYSAAASTLGSIILNLSSLFSRDIAKHMKPDMTEKTETVVGQGAMGLLLLVCVVFAWHRPGMIAVLSSMASGGLLVMAPGIIGAFFWERATAAGALVSMLIGGVATALMYLMHIYPFGWWPSVWGLLLTTALFVGINFATSPPENAREFLDQLESELEAHGFRRRGRVG